MIRKISTPNALLPELTNCKLLKFWWSSVVFKHPWSSRFGKKDPGSSFFFIKGILMPTPSLHHIEVAADKT